MERDSAGKTAASVLFWLFVWEAAALMVNQRLLLAVPTPVDTLRALFRMLQSVSFYRTVGASLLRICLGFLMALLAGTLCAVLSARYELFRTATKPLLHVIRSIPVASFTILVFLWISREKIPSAISFFTVFPIVWENIETGLRSADTALVEMAQVYGMRRIMILRRITLPGIRPYFLSASASGLGFAWKSGVAAEIICRTANSLGNLLWGGKNSISYDEVFAITLVIVLLSTMLQWAAKKILQGRSCK